MKFILKNLLLVLLSVILFSCTVDENTKVEQDSFLSKKIINNDINNISVKYQNAIFLEGKFKIIKPTKNQLVIYTETNDKKHVFLFDDVDESFDLNQNIKKLSYLKNGIILNDDLFLGVKGNVSNGLTIDSKKISKNNNLNRNENFKVLIYKWYSKSNPAYQNISIEELISESAKVMPSAGSVCDSGGAGSTSCSLSTPSGTGCSVSCGSGYYACCIRTFSGPDSCKCLKVK